MPRFVSRPKPSVVPDEAVLRKIRIPFVQRAQLVHASREHDVFLVDLGLFGVFVELSDPLPLGDGVDVTFVLPGNEIPLSARCRVSWWHPSGQAPKQLPAGLGLEFVEMSPPDRHRLREHLLDHFRRQAGGRRFSRPWPGKTSFE
jgi:Tfp pilus assembly protein PilZ